MLPYVLHGRQPVLHALCLPLVPCAGSYHGLAPTNRVSGSYGILHYTTDKSGKVTDMTIWRAGFQEEREVLVSTISEASSCACADMAWCGRMRLQEAQRQQHLAVAEWVLVQRSSNRGP